MILVLSRSQRGKWDIRS